MAGSNNSKVVAYLREREGQEVPFAELHGALGGRVDTLRAYVSRLVNDQRSGVRYVGAQRLPGRPRPLRYDPVPDPVHATFRVVGTTADGHRIGRDEKTGDVYELRLIGQLSRQEG